MFEKCNYGIFDENKSEKNFKEPYKSRIDNTNLDLNMDREASYAGFITEVNDQLQEKKRKLRRSPIFTYTDRMRCRNFPNNFEPMPPECEFCEDYSCRNCKLYYVLPKIASNLGLDGMVNFTDDYELSYQDKMEIDLFAEYETNEPNISNLHKLFDDTYENNRELNEKMKNSSKRLNKNKLKKPTSDAKSLSGKSTNATETNSLKTENLKETIMDPDGEVSEILKNKICSGLEEWMNQLKIDDQINALKLENVDINSLVSKNIVETLMKSMKTTSSAKNITELISTYISNFSLNLLDCILNDIEKFPKSNANKNSVPDHELAQSLSSQAEDNLKRKRTISQDSDNVTSGKIFKKRNEVGLIYSALVGNKNIGKKIKDKNLLKNNGNQKSKMKIRNRAKDPITNKPVSLKVIISNIIEGFPNKNATKSQILNKIKSYNKFNHTSIKETSVIQLLSQKFKKVPGFYKLNENVNSKPIYATNSIKDNIIYTIQHFFPNGAPLREIQQKYMEVFNSDEKSCIQTLKINIQKIISQSVEIDLTESQSKYSIK